MKKRVVGWLLSIAFCVVLVGTCAHHKQVFAQVTHDLSGQSLVLSESILNTFYSSPQTQAILSDGNPNNNLVIVVADSIVADGFFVTSADMTDGRRADGPVTVAFVAREWRVIPSTQGALPGFNSFYFIGYAGENQSEDVNPVDWVILAEKASWGGERDVPLEIRFPQRSRHTNWSAVFAYNELATRSSLPLDLNPVQRMVYEESYLVNGEFPLGFEDRLAAGRRSSVRLGGRLCLIQYGTGDESGIATTRQLKTAMYTGPINGLPVGRKRRSVEWAATAWKAAHFARLERELRLSGFPGQLSPEGVLKQLQETPFNALGVSGPATAEYVAAATALRQRIKDVLPSHLVQPAIVNQPGGIGHVTVNTVVRPSESSFRLVPYLAFCKRNGEVLGTLARVGDHLQLSFDLALTTSHVASSQVAGGVLRYSGQQPVRVTEAGCDFGGVISAEANDAGGNSCVLTLTLDGYAGGPALARLASPMGLPVNLRLVIDGPEFEESVSLRQTFGVSLSRQTRADVLVSGGQVSNRSDSGVYVLWVPKEAGGTAGPAEGRAVLVEPGGTVPLTSFSGADPAGGPLPPEALQFVVSDPLGLLNQQNPDLFQKVVIENRIPAVLTIAGADLPVDWVEVTLTTERGLRYGPFNLSPRNAVGSQVSVPRLQEELLKLTGTVVLQGGGTLPLRETPVTGLSVLIDRQAIAE